MHSLPFSRIHRSVCGVVLCVCLAVFLASAFGCGKKSLEPSRYGGAPATTPSVEPEVWAPPRPDAQAPERDLKTESVPQAKALEYEQPDDVMVPVYEDVYQLASFSTQEYARRFTQRAQNAGFSTSIEDAMVGGQAYYRVIGTIQGTESEIKQAVQSLGVNPVQRSHDRVEGRLVTPSAVQSSMGATEEPEAAINALAAELSESSDPFATTEEGVSPPMSAGEPALLEPEEPVDVAAQLQYESPEPVRAPPESPQNESRGVAESEPEDPMLGPSYRAPMRQPGASVGTETAAVSKRSVSPPQPKPATPQRQSGIIPPSAPPTFIGSPTCQEKNGRLVASAVGRADDPLRAERIAVDQAKRSLLLCVQAYREEAGLASGPRLTSLPINYLEISDPQRRPDGSVFVSVGIAVEDIPKLTAGR